MDRWQRRTGSYIATLAAVIIGFAVAYDYGMTVFEGRPQLFYRRSRPSASGLDPESEGRTLR